MTDTPSPQERPALAVSHEMLRTFWSIRRKVSTIAFGSLFVGLLAYLGLFSQSVLREVRHAPALSGEEIVVYSVLIALGAGLVITKLCELSVAREHDRMLRILSAPHLVAISRRGSSIEMTFSPLARRQSVFGLKVDEDAECFSLSIDDAKQLEELLRGRAESQSAQLAGTQSAS